MGAVLQPTNMLFRMVLIAILVFIATAKPFTKMSSTRLLTGIQLVPNSSIKHSTVKINDKSLEHVIFNDCTGTIGKDTFRGLSQLDTLTLWKSRVDSINGTFTFITHFYAIKSHLPDFDEDLVLKFPVLREVKLIANQDIKVDPLQFPKLKHLSRLHISQANFTESCVTRRWFQNMDKMLELVLNDNQLSCIEEDAFNGLKNLKKLDLTYNNIAKLGEFVFNGLIMMEQLGMYGNKLEGFQLEMLSSQRMHLELLGVDWSVLKDSKVKPEDLMRMIHRLKVISFGHGQRGASEEEFCRNLRPLGAECRDDVVFGLSRILMG